MHKLTIVKLVLVLAAALMLANCSQSPTGVVDNPTEATKTLDNTVDVTGITVYGNCLSMPVVFAEGHGLTGEDPVHFSGLRGTPGVEYFVEPYDATLIDGYPVYRNPSVNEWQASWSDGLTWGGEVPCELDWADNMTRQTWNERSQVRVEAVLFAAVDPILHPLTGYNMYSLGGTQLSEVFVTNTTKYLATLATVYSNVARLKIQKLDAQGGVPVVELYNSACYDGYFVDGPSDAFTAEVNMGGKCIYGFNWNMKEVPLANKVGWYRLTLTFDAEAIYTDYDGVNHMYPRNTIMTSLNPADLYGYNDPEVVLYQPTLSADGYTSTLDIYIAAKTPKK